MNEDLILEISRHVLMVIAMISFPTLFTALIVGIVVSLFQAMTQINEATLSYIPKLIAVGLVLLVGGHWMLMTLVNYTRDLYLSIPHLIGIR